VKDFTDDDFSDDDGGARDNRTSEFPIIKFNNDIIRPSHNLVEDFSEKKRSIIDKGIHNLITK
jgi:hypothetical protein